MCGGHGGGSNKYKGFALICVVKCWCKYCSEIMKINIDIILYIAAACVGIGSSLADDNGVKHHLNAVVQQRRMLVVKMR